MQTLLSKNEVPSKKGGERNWVFILPTLFIFVFLFVSFLPFSGWISGVAGVDRSWISFVSVLVSSTASILALLAAYLGGKLLPRLFYADHSGR